MALLCKNSCGPKHKYGNKTVERGRLLVTIICIPKHIFIHHTITKRYAQDSIFCGLSLYENPRPVPNKINYDDC